MPTETLPTGPDPEAITRTILEKWPETDMVEALGATFFSLDPERDTSPTSPPSSRPMSTTKVLPRTWRGQACSD